MSTFQTSLQFDMRAPDFGAPAPQLYQAALDMAAFGDRIGMDRLGLMEHHGSDDGYLTSPFVLGGAMAARTQKIRLCLGAVILPLHDPVKVAEQIAVLDQISGGRLDVIFGAGYVQHEFDMFKVSLHDRAKLLDASIETIIRALRGERFDADGREVFVRPLPIQKPEEILYVGGGVKASAARAAKFDLGFVPISKKLLPIYEEECRNHGRTPRRMYSTARPLCIHLAEDVDAGWKDILPNALHAANAYAKWAEGEGAKGSPFHGLTNEEALRAAGIFEVWTPQQLLKKAAEMSTPATLGFQPLLGGLAPEIGWKSLRLLETVMPELCQIKQRKTGGT